MSIPLFGRMSRVGHIRSKEYIRPLTAAEKAVIYALSDEHGRLGAYAEIDIPELVYRTRFSERAVQYALRTLEHDQGLKSDRPEKQHRNEVTRYHLNEDAFVIVEKARRVHIVHPRKGAPRAEKGAPGAPPLIPFSLKKYQHPIFPKVVPSSKEILGLDPARPDKGARAGGKHPPVDQEELEVIEGLLMAKLGQVDARLSPGIVHDCRAINREITLEQMVLIVTKALLEPMPANPLKPNGLIRTRVRMAARASYLAALDQAAEKRRDALKGKGP